MIFIVSDTHFGHRKSFLFEPRGFSSIEEHDKTIINNWNSVVSHDDVVYHLGDLGMGTDFEYLADCVNQLNGKIYWIYGNHCTNNKILQLSEKCPNLVGIGYATIIKDGKWSFYLSHYPTAVGNFDDELKHSKFYSLCGHSHVKDRWKDFHTMKSYHCELDAHSNYPVSLDEIKEDIKALG